MEEFLEELADWTKGMAKSIELFTWGEHFLRVWEIWKLEGPEETGKMLRKHRRRLESVEKKLEKSPDKEPEVVQRQM